jgi:hypothetical protein
METLPRTPTQAFLHSDVIGEEIADDLIFFRCPNWVASAALSNVFDGRLDLGPRPDHWCGKEFASCKLFRRPRAAAPPTMPSSASALA